MYNPFKDATPRWAVVSDLQELKNDLAKLKQTLAHQGLSVRPGRLDVDFYLAYNRVVRGDTLGELEGRMVARMDALAKAAGVVYIPPSTTPGGWVKLED